MRLLMNSSLKRIATMRCRELRKKQTNAEKIFWEIVRNRKFMGLKINRQFPIYFESDGKESFFIADFHCFEKKLVIEIDGKIHERQQTEDLVRTKILNELGFNVIRFKNDEVENNINEVLVKLKNYIKNLNI